MAGRGCILLILPPQAISYRIHQKSLAYCSHLEPLARFFLLKDGVKKRGRHGPMPFPPPKYAIERELINLTYF